MSLHEFAWDAYVQSQQDQTGTARQALAAVLDGYDVSAMDVVELDVTPARTRVTFKDGAVHLRVTLRPSKPPEVRLVTPQPNGQWQEVGDAIGSAADLGKLLGQPVGEDHPDWYQRHSPDGWPLGSVVAHIGKLWRSTVPDNTWEPPYYGWEEVTG